MIFGENLLALLVLALGAALAVGNIAALVRPRPIDQVGDDELVRPPLGRSLVMILIGTVAALWAVISLIADEDPPEVEATELVVLTSDTSAETFGGSFSV